MNVFTKLYLIQHILRWRLTWTKRDTRYVYGGGANPRFLSARAAVGLIKDGDVVATSGMAGNQRLAVLYWAMRELYQESGHPGNITMLCTGGQGSRGRVPGSMEELGVKGLNTRLITGHQETFKAQLRLAEQGAIEMQCLPQGVITWLIEGQGRGEDSLVTSIGVGTFMDPRVGRGSNILDPNAENLVSVEGDRLRYRAPKINVAMFSAPAADTEGNIYLRGASIIAETHEIVRAARKNGGRVIAAVGMIVDKGYGEISIPADQVDAVVHDPWCEQSFTIKYRKLWKLLTPESDMPIEEGIERLRFISNVLGITPKRTAVDDAVARLAAMTFSENAPHCKYVNIGVGLPEEVCRMLFEAGLLKDAVPFTETGVIGGLPGPGVFFGAAACPTQMVSSAEVFRLVAEKLDVTVLGVVEADSEGNVNVSKRGEGPRNYVGPGGFIDITTGAKMIIFVAAWMPRGQVEAANGEIRIVKPDTPKFRDRVSEITFCGKEALKAGKKVFYATTVGLFELTERGMELRRVMPGIDIQKDIIEPSSMKVVLPESGSVPVVDRSVVTGESFRLDMRPAPAPAEVR